MPINTQKDRKNLYLRLSNMDITTKLMPLLKTGAYYRRPSDGKYAIKNPAIPNNNPWVYTRTDPDARCGLYHQVFFNCLNHIHSYCRECYKVVVRPRNLVEQFDWYEVQRTILDTPCKLGIERRDTVGSLYGAYHYFRGKKAGQEGYKYLRSLADEYLSKETPAILKRYCTEFEITESGENHPSNKTPDITKDEKAWEESIENLFSEPDGIKGIVGGGYPLDMIAHVMKSWIHWAYQNGDQTYKEFTDGSPLFPPYVTYHEEKKSGGKKK